MNYRKLYETHFDIKLSKDYDVHHIDFDRENNTIDNLIAMPNKLHRNYHKLLLQNKNYHSNNMLHLELNTDVNINIHNNTVKFIKNMSTILNEISKYTQYKKCLELNINPKDLFLPKYY